MSDIALLFNNTIKEYDISVKSGDLATCDDLESAVIISLFTWARATSDEVAPNSPRYGWWGDKVDPDNADNIGSKLYLLKRAKITTETIANAEEYIRQALNWMIEDKVASEITAEVSRNEKDVNRLDALVTITRGDCNRTMRFNDLWSML